MYCALSSQQGQNRPYDCKCVHVYVHRACTCTRACACCACICGVGETIDGQLLQVTTTAAQPAAPPAAPAAAAAIAGARARHSASCTEAAALLVRRPLWLGRFKSAVDVSHTKLNISITRFSTCRTRMSVPNVADASNPATACQMLAVHNCHHWRCA